MAHAWERIFADVVVVLIATFLFVYGALAVRDATILTLVYGAALTLLGFPAALRLDRRRNNRGEE